MGPLPILSVSGVEVAVIALVGFAVFGGWIGKQLKRLRDRGERQRSEIQRLMEGGGREGSEGETGVRPEVTLARDATARAARRKAEMERLIRGGPQARPPASPAQSDVDRALAANMASGDPDERRRAKAIYQQRAEALRRQRELAAAQARIPSGNAGSRNTLLADILRQAEEIARGRQPAGPRASGSQPATTPVRTAVATLAQAAPPKRAGPARGEAVMPTMGAAATRQSAEPSATERAGAAMRPAAKAVPIASGARLASGVGARLSLRDAMILKEILDPPLALREPAEPL